MKWPAAITTTRSCRSIRGWCGSSRHRFRARSARCRASCRTCCWPWRPCSCSNSVAGTWETTERLWPASCWPSARSLDHLFHGLRGGSLAGPRPGCLLAAERDQRAVAGVLIALTAVTSLPGALMVCHLAIILLRRDGWRPRFSQAWLLLGPVAAAGFLAYVAHLTGSLDAYSANQAGWGRTGLGTADGDAAMGAALGPIQMVLLLTLCASVSCLYTPAWTTSARSTRSCRSCCWVPLRVRQPRVGGPLRDRRVPALLADGRPTRAGLAVALAGVVGRHGGGIRAALVRRSLGALSWFTRPRCAPHASRSILTVVALGTRNPGRRPIRPSRGPPTGERPTR